MSAAHLVFRVLYSLLYFFFCLLLSALVLITPADLIIQAAKNKPRYVNIVIVAIAYLVATSVVLFVYSLRLYITRTILASIPKQWIPIGKGDVRKDVQGMIAKELGRSAAIAWAARPKVRDADWDAPADEWRSGVSEAQRDEMLQDVPEEAEDTVGNTDNEKPGGPALPLPHQGMTLVRSISTRMPSQSLKLDRKSTAAVTEMGITLPPTLPVWGVIEHPGWGSPENPDLPNVQYSTVVIELPNLIEARAVSLAPPDMEASAALSEDLQGNAALDEEAVMVLQRSLNMGMRDYVVHLTGLGVLPAASTDDQPDITRDISEFLDTYERARFSGRPMKNVAFRRLMHLFAELLRAMQPLDPAVLDTLEDISGGMYTESGSGNYGDIDDDAPRETRTASLVSPGGSIRDFCRTKSFSSSIMSKSSSVRNTGKQRTRRPDMPARNSTMSAGTWGPTLYGTAPSTPQSYRRVSKSHVPSRPSSKSGQSVDSFAQTGRPFAGSDADSMKSASGGSMGSGRSGGSAGSVIRLARREDQLSGYDLPYVLRVGDRM